MPRVQLVSPKLRSFIEIGAALLLAVGAGGAVTWASRAAPARPALVYHGVMRRSPIRGAGVEVDLYVPPRTDRPPPLLIVVLGGRADAHGDEQRVGAGIGDAMQREGVAVAVVRFALADAYLLPRAADDVAAVVRALADASAAYGYDASRPVLAGQALGASLAAMIALDGRSLSRAGFDPARLGGVVVARGTYDLSDAALDGHPDRELLSWAFGGDTAARTSAAPIAHVKRDAPPFLILSGAGDAPEWSQLARAFAEALERAGASSVERFVVPGHDGSAALDLAGESSDLRTLVTTFIRAGAAPMPLDGPWGVLQLWTQRPPLSSEPFWSDPRLVSPRPVDERFKSAVERVLGGWMYELHAWPGKHYQAIDLSAYLDARPAEEVGRGAHVIVTNVRDERIVMTRADVDRYRPVIVVGLDDERNLYKLVTSYQLDRMYSWRAETGRPPVMARPVGAFLHFPEEPPARLRNLTYAAYGLTPKSFRLVAEDPLGPMRGLTGGVADAMLGEQGCLGCHAFRGAGSRSHHVRADTGEGHGAYALPLEEYPPDVLHRFLFDQGMVATSFGVLPLAVEEKAAHALEDLVAQARPSALKAP